MLARDMLALADELHYDAVEPELYVHDASKMENIPFASPIIRALDSTTSLLCVCLSSMHRGRVRAVRSRVHGAVDRAVAVPCRDAAVV